MEPANYSYTGIIDGHEYVDLGLSVNWATCNVGTKTPSNYGNYFAWGETKSKLLYQDNDCLTMDNEIGNIAGNPTYDATRKIWGAPWRMPTREEFEELIIECNWEWVSQGEQIGYKITGPTGKSIFLPAAGVLKGDQLRYFNERGKYWSGTSHPDFSGAAFGLTFYYYNKNIVYVQDENPNEGRCIRPVIDNDYCENETYEQTINEI